MAPSTPPSCFLIGADTLLTECGELLLERGFDVRGVITRTDRVRTWAAGKGLACLDLDADWAAALSPGSFDYLFSITHLELLPGTVLGLPAKGAINFHDAPLPDYAGLYCPVWGLLDGRTEWGVSWHAITEGIDEGDVFEERTFAVAPDETTISLNTKCFQAGLESFAALADRLLAGPAEGRPQSGDQVRMCRGSARPSGAGAIDWSRSATELERLVRALDFGRYANAFGSARFALPSGGAISIDAATAVEGEGEPGTLLELNAGSMKVACGEGALRVSSLRDADGQPVAFDSLAFEAGARLPLLGQGVADRLGKLAKRAAKREGSQVAALVALEPTELPHVERSPEPSAGGLGEHAFEVPASFASAYPGGPTVGAAFAAWLGRLQTSGSVALALRHPENDARTTDLEDFVDPRLAVQVPFDGTSSWPAFAASFGAAAHAAIDAGPLARDLGARYPEVGARPEFSGGRLLPLGIQPDGLPGAPAGDVLTLCAALDAPRATLRYDAAHLGAADAARVAEQFTTFLEALATAGDAPLAEVPLIGQAELERLSASYRATERQLDGPLTLAAQFEARAAACPTARAVTFDGESVTYAELDARANRLAHHLVALGLAPEQPVGVHLNRGHNLLVGILGVLKAGACYVPLDPDFPANRLEWMLEDSAASLIVSESALDGALPASNERRTVRLDADAAAIGACGDASPGIEVRPEALAYVIYTSGSTGKPKGVAVEQHNVANFFCGMDERLQPAAENPGRWLAVTSLSFDISVLELLWTLTRGFEVVVHRDRTKHAAAAAASAGCSERPEPVDFSIFLWGNDDGPGSQKYRLMLEAAKFGDAHGFEAIWTPERHFHAFGGPFPNPSVVSAAIAAVTTRLQIRAGSCVVPLHHPIRIAEEWAVVDNLSNGRVGLSVASGWQPDDFVIRPEGYENNKQVMMDTLDQVRRLWRGEALTFTNPLGDEVERTSLPRPVQPELPVWVTSAGNPETYRLAGASGANVLTHLLGQSVEEVAEKIRVYREARAEAGLDPATGRVTLMLHAFIGEDVENVRELVRAPMKSYLDAAVGLVKKYAWSFPTFKDANSVADIDLDSVTPEEQDAILEHAFTRYFDESGLFGTPESCVEMVDTLKAVGVNEIGCLVDYGVPTDTVLEMLPRLAELLQRCQPASSGDAATTPGELMAAGPITHLQCTPSMARMLLADPAARAGLGRLERMMVGGEACPLDLAQELAEVVGTGVVTNMYGPTETTIWSSTAVLERGLDEVTIGTPIANTRLHVLDAGLRPVPEGVAGELWIAGRGVVRGYFGAEAMTAERFVPETLPGTPGTGRMYRTGDLALRRADGSFGFLGRIDHQVKVRGYRIELGEIETALLDAPEIRAAVVIAREDTPGDQRLVGYFVARAGATVDGGALKERLRLGLPEYMVPGHLVQLDALPETPNGKIDRKALPAPESLVAAERSAPAAPLENELENRLAGHWSEVLGLPSVGATDNFFELGGHSLLVVKLHRRLAGDLEASVSLTDLYRFPTIRGLAAFLEGGSNTESVEESSRRGDSRRAALQARRSRLRRR